MNQAIGKPYVQRNWELQFVGNNNENKLKSYLLKNNLENFVPKGIIKDYFDLFVNGDKLQNAHPINMLLVLSQFNKMNT